MPNKHIALTRLLPVLMALVVAVVSGTHTVWADSSYPVQAGDNLTKIAARFNVTVEAIMRANNLSNPNTIRIGQVLVIPDGAPVAAAPAGETIYIVQPGDSLSRVAAKFNLTINDLLTANPLRSSTLQIGQRLVIPGAPASATPASPIYGRIRGTNAFIARVTAALDWLKDHDPEAFSRAETYITIITASPFRHLAVAVPLANGCQVRALARADTAVEMAAALLYHEASHCYQFATQGKLTVKEAEIFAYAEQIAFMERNGYSAEVLAYYREVLNYYASQPDDGRAIPPPDF